MNLISKLSSVQHIAHDQESTHADGGGGGVEDGSGGDDSDLSAVDTSEHLRKKLESRNIETRDFPTSKTVSNLGSLKGFSLESV